MGLDFLVLVGLGIVASERFAVLRAVALAIISLICGMNLSTSGFVGLLAGPDMVVAEELVCGVGIARTEMRMVGYKQQSIGG